MFFRANGEPDYGPHDTGQESGSSRPAPAPLRRVFRPIIVGGKDEAAAASPPPAMTAATHRIHNAPLPERPTLEDITRAARTDSWQALALYLQQNPGPENRSEAFAAITGIAPAKGIICAFIRYVDLMESCAGTAKRRPYDDLETFASYFAAWQRLGGYGIESFGPAPNLVS